MQSPEPSRSPTAKAEAYQLYLKGRYHWNKRTPDEMKRAIEYFQHAVTVDSSYALAYSGLADCYSMLVDYGNLPAREAMPLAKSAALRARELDDSLAEAHASLGNISTIYDWDWAAAESSFTRALQLNPGYALGHVWYAKFLSRVGQIDKAVMEGRLAADLDPLSLPVNTNFGAYLYYARRYDDAREQLEKTLELDRSFSPAHFWLGKVYVRQGRLTEALTESDKITADPQARQLLAVEALAVSGRRADAMNIVHEWGVRRPESSEVPPSCFAQAYSSLGENEVALEWLKRAYEERDGSVLVALTFPSFDGLRRDPRFVALFARMGLPYRSIK
jgi:Tfp pilus assembly protein PilF